MKQGCSVFVGNIDFDVPEQKIVEELSAVGKVVSFRLMYDKATGRSKGYGFCEYESPLIAETAMKTLKINFNGRPVKINYAESDMPTKGREQAQKQSQIESIVAALDSMDKENVLEVMSYFKRMAIDQPSQLKELLSKHPQLIVALVTALVKLDLCDSEKVQEVIEKSFDVTKLRDQIIARIGTISETDMDGMAEDTKTRILFLKNQLAKKSETRSGGRY